MTQAEIFWFAMGANVTVWGALITMVFNTWRKGRRDDRDRHNH